MAKKPKKDSRFDTWYPIGTFVSKYPVEVSDVEMAFPAKVDHLMPPAEIIPEEFHHSLGTSPWARFTHNWFGGQYGHNITFHPKDKIDAQKAYRHIMCVLGTYSSKHQYKMSAAAYLCSLFFEDVTGSSNKSLVFI